MASRSAERRPTAEQHSASTYRSIDGALWPLLVVLDLVLCVSLVRAGTLDLVAGLFAGVGVAAVAGLAMLALGQQRVVRRMLSIVRHRDQLASSLRAERDRAADSSASKTRFFAAASHDLRQPLHALSINATTLQLVAGRQADPVIRDLSLSINRALLRSNGLLDSLLDLSRLDANAVKLKPEPINVIAFLKAVVEQFRPSAQERGLSIDSVASPAIHRDMSFTTDRAMMFRIMSNLMSNAIKFTAAGGVSLNASIETDGSLALQVIDSGRGIEASELPHIFEEFYQVGSSQRDIDGSLGLGLSIVRRAVDLLAMTIHIESEVGTGTIVTLRIPAPDGDLVSPQSSDNAPLSESAIAEGEPIRALLVEDEKEICDSLVNFMPYLGFEVRSASNSNEALALIASGFMPTVLVIDQLLREETGLLVVHRLWRVMGRVPAVMVTGDTDLATAELAAASGMRLVHKPIDGMRLAIILREVQNEVHASSKTVASDQTSRS